MVTTIFLDSIQTCLSLEPLRKDVADLGLRADDLELWFTRALRDAFVREVVGAFEPFKDVLARALCGVASLRHKQIDDSDARKVVERFAELPPHADVRPALELARDRGAHVYVLTNGGEKATRKAFERANLEKLVAGFISVDDVRHFKPAREVYVHAATTAGSAPDACTLVAAHAWDVMGALQAGLAAGYVERSEPLPSELASRVKASAPSLDGVFSDLLRSDAARRSA